MSCRSAWTAQVRATEIVRDRELLKLMQRTNCIMLYLGLESVNPQTLIEYNKKQSVEQIVEAIKILKEYGIRAHGMFVFGADGDTVESIRHTADFVIKNDISTVQFMILTPLPGTRNFQQLHEQGRIFDYDWSRYDAHHTVYWPKNLSPYELQIETFAAMRKVYGWGRIAAPVLQGNYLTTLLPLLRPQPRQEAQPEDAPLRGNSSPPRQARHRVPRRQTTDTAWLKHSCVNHTEAAEAIILTADHKRKSRRKTQCPTRSPAWTLIWKIRVTGRDFITR